METVLSFDWLSLWKQLGMTAVIAGAMGWAAKRIAEAWLSQRLQQHKTTIEAEAQRTLERVRADIRLEEARQSRLLTRQATIIAGVLMRLERVHEALRVLSAPVFHQDGNALPLRDSAIERFNEFSTHYHERAIWLEKATCDRMNVLVGLLKKLLTELDYNLTPGGAIQDRTRWIETYKRIQEEVPVTRGDLDEHFRLLLGVSRAEARAPAAQ